MAGRNMRVMRKRTTEKKYRPWNFKKNYERYAIAKKPNINVN